MTHHTGFQCLAATALCTDLTGSSAYILELGCSASCIRQTHLVCKHLYCPTLCLLVDAQVFLLLGCCLYCKHALDTALNRAAPAGSDIVPDGL